MHIVDTTTLITLGFSVKSNQLDQLASSFVVAAGDVIVISCSLCFNRCGYPTVFAVCRVSTSRLSFAARKLNIVSYRETATNRRTCKKNNDL